MSLIIKYGLQPTLMVGVLSLWYFNQDAAWVYLLVALGVQVLLALLEHFWPARPEWVQPIGYKGALGAVFIATYVFGGAIVAPLYAQTVNPALAHLRSTLGLDVWPTEWPIIAQVLLAFFMSEFIWY
ncbi:MAG: hypothetical protein AAGA68_15935 [Pseudomonadota bacterium]